MMDVVKVVVPEDLWPSRRDWSASVVEVYKREGDTVREGEPLADVELEKAIVTIESPVAGVVEKIFVEPGDRVGPGDPVATIKASGM